MFGYPVLFSIEFNAFTSPFTTQFGLYGKDISDSRESVSSVIQTPRISSKILRCSSYFQLSSRCLDTSMKHFLLCLISYIYLLTKCARAVAWTVLVWTSDLSAVNSFNSLQLTRLLFFIGNFQKLKGDQCDCPVPCDTISFKPVLSYALFPSDNYVRLTHELDGEHSSNASESTLRYIQEYIRYNKL